MTDVLSASYGDDWTPTMNNVKKKDSLSTSPSLSLTSFVLHYAACGSKSKWRHHSVTMSHSDPRQIGSWVKTIQNYLNGL